MTAKPFCDGPFSILKGTNWIVGKDKHGDICHVLDQRGWGYLTGKGHSALRLDSATASQMQADMQQWVVDALNAAWNRRADLAAVSAQVLNLIPRMDAIQACQVGPSDEWSKATKSGYEQAATDCQRNILRIKPAAIEPQPDPRDEVIARLVEAAEALLTQHTLENPMRIGDFHGEMCQCRRCGFDRLSTALAAAKAVQHD